MLAPMSVGLIGAGTMGRGIGLNLLRRGYTLTVYDISSQAVDALVAQGARGAASPGDVAASSETIITVLPDGPDVEAAVLGPNGVLSGARPGTLLVECSTIDPGVTQQVGETVRAAGLRMVDAALGGGWKSAEEGSLILMLGATPEDYAVAEPLLKDMSRKIYHCGGPGAGISMKLVTNLLGLTILTADVEALVLGAKAGLDPEMMVRIFSETAADNKHLRLTIPDQVLTGDYAPTFKASLALKDVSLGEALAARCGVPVFALGAARTVYGMAVERGKGELGNGVIAAVLEELAGIQLAKRS